MGQTQSSEPDGRRVVPPPPAVLRQTSMENMGRSLLTRAYAEHQRSSSRLGELVHKGRDNHSRRLSRASSLSNAFNSSSEMYERSMSTASGVSDNGGDTFNTMEHEGDSDNSWDVHMPQGCPGPTVTLGGGMSSIDRSVSDRFQFDKLLGSGMYAQVFLAKRSRTCERVLELHRGSRQRHHQYRKKISSFARRGDMYTTNPVNATDRSTPSTRSPSTQLEKHASVSPASDLPRYDAVAIKVIPRETVDRGYEEQMRHEAMCLERLSDHPHIVQMHEFTEGERNFYMIMELVPSTILETIVRCHYSKDTTFHINVATMGAIFRQLLSALAHCHSHGIAHLDIKPDNLLVGPDGQVRLCDFGLAARVPCRRAAHTLLFAPPEIFTEKRAYAATDMWAAGVLLFVLLTGYFPFNTKVGVSDLKRRICQGISPAHLDCARGLSKSSKHLISQLVCVPWQSRLGAKEAMQHKWFAELDVQGDSNESVQRTSGPGSLTQADEAIDMIENMSHHDNQPSYPDRLNCSTPAVLPAIVQNLRQISIMPPSKTSNMVIASLKSGLASDKEKAEQHLQKEALMHSMAAGIPPTTDANDGRENSGSRNQGGGTCGHAPPPLLRGPSLEKEIDDLMAW